MPYWEPGARSLSSRREMSIVKLKEDPAKYGDFALHADSLLGERLRLPGLHGKSNETQPIPQ